MFVSGEQAKREAEDRLREQERKSKKALDLAKANPAPSQPAVSKTKPFRLDFSTPKSAAAAAASSSELEEAQKALSDLQAPMAPSLSLSLWANLLVGKSDPSDR